MPNEQPVDLKRWQKKIVDGDPADDEALMLLSLKILREADSTRPFVLKEKLGLGYATASRIVGVLEDRGLISFAKKVRTKER